MPSSRTPLHTLQLSLRPRQHRIPQVLKVLAAATFAWLLVGLVAWLGSLL